MEVNFWGKQKSSLEYSKYQSENQFDLVLLGQNWRVCILAIKLDTFVIGTTACKCSFFFIQCKATM